MSVHIWQGRESVCTLAPGSVFLYTSGLDFMLVTSTFSSSRQPWSIQWPWPSQGCTCALLWPHLWFFPHVFYWGTIYTQRLSLLWSTVLRILPKTCATTAVKIWNSSMISSYFPVPLCGRYSPPPHFLATTAVFCPYDFACLRTSYRQNHVVCREDSSMLSHLFNCWVALVWMYWFCLSTYQLEDICLTSSFEKLWTKDNKHLHTGICVNFSFHFSWHTLDFFIIMVRTQHEIYALKLLSAKYSIVNYRCRVVQQIPRTYSSCVTKLYTLCTGYKVSVSASPRPPATTILLSFSVSLTILDTSYEWNQVVFVLLWLLFHLA